MALVTISLNIRAVRKTDLEILKLKLDLQKASSRIYVPTSEEIKMLMETIKVSEKMSTNLYEAARDHIFYMQSSNKQSHGIMENSASLEDSIRSLEVRLSSVTCLLEEWIYNENLQRLERTSTNQQR